MKIPYLTRPLSWIHAGIAILFFCFGFPACAQSAAPQSPSPMIGPIVRQAVHHDVSPALRDLRTMRQSQLSTGDKEEAEPVRRIPLRSGSKTSQPDTVVQSAANAPSPELAVVPGQNIEGLGNGQNGFTVRGAPPDTNGAVGLGQYVQWVNTSFSWFDKRAGSGAIPTSGSTLWAGFGGPCQDTNRGDPIVTYDKMANRWVFSQFAFTSTTTGPFLQCIAVSAGPSLDGAYNRYSFSYSNFDDYPKMSVWPDAYYVTFNMFDPSTGHFVGADLCAYDRTAMLNGQAATQICFQQGASIGGVLPSDFDGTILPPAGSPNFMLALDSNLSSLDLFKFHVDFATPNNSTLTGPTNIPVAPFVPLCGGGTCVPQPGTTQQLDSLADRLMYRLAYRNFGSHESLVVSHSVSVNSGSSGGVRWYELEDPNGSVTVAQQSTFAPDSSFRWMGSIAMDKVGNMALGYSLSSSTINPSVAVTGRMAGDPLNTMQAENIIVNGTGSQVGNSSRGPLTRWGDYSAMQIDPADDCTFWFTTEYMKTTGVFNWNTRIASFKFPNCNAVDPHLSSLSFNPGVVNSGGSSTGTVTLDITAPAVTTFSLTSDKDIVYVPPTFYVLAGDKSATFSTVTTPTATQVTAIVTASLNGSSQQGTLTVNASSSPVLLVHRQGQVFGTVTSNDGLIDCGSTCSAAYNTPNTVTLTAASTFNATFTGWSGACSGTGTCSVTMSASQTVTANFIGGLGFIPITPCRVVDTRNTPNGTFAGPSLSGQTSRAFPIPSGACPIPSTAQAYSFNVTVVPHAGLGFLNMYPCGPVATGSSTLNSFDGRVKAVGAIVPAAFDGNVCAYTTHDTDLILDINGYFVPNTTPNALAFYPMTPCRLVDTRNAGGPLGGPPLVGQTSRIFPLLSGSCNVPNTAQAYSLNVTAVPPRSGIGFLTVWPAGQAQPLASTLNAPALVAIANAAIVPAGTNGDVSVFTTHDTDLILDVNGYFAPPGSGGLSLFNVPPCRVLDTRFPLGTPAFTGAKDVNVFASSCGVPLTAQAYVLNATVVPPGLLGFLTLWPQGVTQPNASTLNSFDAAVNSNMAITPTTNGLASAYASSPTHLIIDISGYFSGVQFSAPTPQGPQAPTASGGATSNQFPTAAARDDR